MGQQLVAEGIRVNTAGVIGVAIPTVAARAALGGRHIRRRSARSDSGGLPAEPGSGSVARP